MNDYPEHDMPAKLLALRSALIADGWSASSPASLGPDGERLARQERGD